MKTEILFFGILAEVAGTDSVSMEDQPDLDHLKKAVLQKFPNIDSYRYRISVNKVLTDENCTLNDGDEIAFLPPFAGG